MSETSIARARRSEVPANIMPPAQRGARIAALDAAAAHAARIKDEAAIRKATEEKLAEMAEVARAMEIPGPTTGDLLECMVRDRARLHEMEHGE